MEEEIQEIIEKFEEYMTKKGFDLNTKHNLSRYMTEYYWEEIKGEDNEEIEEEIEDDNEEDWLNELDSNNENEIIPEDEEEDNIDKKTNDLLETKPSMKGLIRKSKIGIKKTKAVIKD